MNLVRWPPVDELTRLHDEMDRIFHRVFGDVQARQPASREGIWSPAVDLYEEGNNLVIKTDLPGVKKEDLNVTTTDEGVTIDAKMEEKKEEKKGAYYRCERRSGRFLRSIPLPATVNAEKAQAVFKDGTLTLTLPKAAEAPKGKKVPVQ